jgi:two-component system sensor histidine kinase VicK
VEQEALIADVLQQVKSLQREQALNAELEASNEELQLLQQQTQLLNQELEARVIQRTQSLAESEARFRNMAEYSAVLIAVYDQQNQPTYFNKAWTELTGLTEQRLLEIDFVKIIHPFDQKLFSDTIKESRENLQPWQLEFRVVNKARNYSWLLAGGTLRYDAGNFGGFVISCADITENKMHQAELEGLNQKLETAYQEKTTSNVELAHLNDELLSIQEILVQSNIRLAENEEVLRMAIQSSAMGTWQINIHSGQLTSSEKSQQIYGLPDGSVVTIRGILKMIDPAYRESFIICIRQALSSHTSFVNEYLIYPTEQSDPKWVRLSGTVRVDIHKRPVTILGTLLDITEQKQDEVRKNDFIGMVSHELKTPLTSINGYLQILSSKVNKEEQLLNNLLAKTGKQTSKMIKMINGFLNVSRLEAGKIMINYLHFDLALLLKEIEEEAITLCTTHRIIFAPVEETWVNADRDKLGQVVENLISNAVKYSPIGSTINIACVTKNWKAIISVKDEGFGIAKNDIPKLFDRFYRVKSHASTIGGFGIGLYLCKEIIDRHHGRLWVESEIDNGSRFYFTIPVVIA